jgi:hypothetical protein
MMKIVDAVTLVEHAINHTLDVRAQERVGQIIHEYAQGQRPISARIEIRDDTVPFKPGEAHVPDYYRLKVRTLEGHVVELDIVDILAAAAARPAGIGSHPFVVFALKYLLRAGRKPGEPAIKDLYKAMEWLQRLLPAEEASG